VVLVAPAELPDWWEEAVPALESMAKASNGRQSVQTLADGIIDGRLQLWTHEGAFAVTAINDWPTGIATLEVLGCVGKSREKWLSELDAMEEWAREQGCVMAETTSRPGWTRALKPLGWNNTHVFLEKAL